MLIGVVGLLLAACNSNPNGYRIQGNVANAGNGIAVLGSSAGRGEAMVWAPVSTFYYTQLTLPTIRSV